jgi:hypothetical protein
MPWYSEVYLLYLIPAEDGQRFRFFQYDQENEKESLIVLPEVFFESNVQQSGMKESWP